MSAKDYRDLIKQVTAEYPGDNGPVPWQLLEGMVQLESGGDNSIPVNYANAQGLGQIVPGGYEYGVAINDPKYVSKCGNAPNLYDPYCNLAISAIGLADRHDAGVNSRATGGYGAWSDWYPAMLGYFGAVGNDSDPKTGKAYDASYTPADSARDNDDGSNSGNDYFNNVTNYLTKEFLPAGNPTGEAQSWKTYTEIDKLGQGAFDPLTNTYDHDALYWDSDGKSFIEGLVDLKDSATGAVDDIGAVLGFVRKISGWIEGLIKFGPRLGFIVLGGVFIIGGIALWST